jgi:hypothetical protein
MGLKENGGGLFQDSNPPFMLRDRETPLGRNVGKIRRFETGASLTHTCITLSLQQFASLKSVGYGYPIRMTRDAVFLKYVYS